MNNSVRIVSGLGFGSTIHDDKLPVMNSDEQQKQGLTQGRGPAMRSLIGEETWLKNQMSDEGLLTTIWRKPMMKVEAG